MLRATNWRFAFLTAGLLCGYIGAVEVEDCNNSSWTYSSSAANEIFCYTLTHFTKDSSFSDSTESEFFNFVANCDQKHASFSGTTKNMAILSINSNDEAIFLRNRISRYEAERPISDDQLVWRRILLGVDAMGWQDGSDFTFLASAANYFSMDATTCVYMDLDNATLSIERCISKQDIPEGKMTFLICKARFNREAITSNFETTVAATIATITIVEDIFVVAGDVIATNGSLSAITIAGNLTTATTSTAVNTITITATTTSLESTSAASATSYTIAAFTSATTIISTTIATSATSSATVSTISTITTSNITFAPTATIATITIFTTTSAATTSISKITSAATTTFTATTMSTAISATSTSSTTTSTGTTTSITTSTLTTTTSTSSTSTTITSTPSNDITTVTIETTSSTTRRRRTAFRRSTTRRRTRKKKRTTVDFDFTDDPEDPVQPATTLRKPKLVYNDDGLGAVSELSIMVVVWSVVGLLLANNDLA